MLGLDKLFTKDFIMVVITHAAIKVNPYQLKGPQITKILV